MGSCFAVEISRWLQKNKFKYLVTEENYGPDGKFHNSSAKWGTLFNAPSIYQTISWSLGVEKRPALYYRVHDEFRDPFREDVEYTDSELSRVSCIVKEHVQCAKLALLQADILIFTVGLNEVFKYLPLDRYLHRTSWGLNPLLWTSKILTVQENENFLQNAIFLLRKYNPGVKIIFTVSPVPLMRTFRSDVHVASATAHSKAVLRVALENLSQKLDDVFYFPSFETVMYPGAIDAWSSDERHVSPEIVEKIMHLFIKQFGSAKTQDMLIFNNSLTNVVGSEYFLGLRQKLLKLKNDGFIDQREMSKILDPFEYAYYSNTEIAPIGYKMLRDLESRQGISVELISAHAPKDKF